jgi:glycolate oxidase FAD binding subunit
MSILSPTSPAELASLLRQASERGQTVECGGNFSKALWGGPVAKAALRVSTAKLNAVLQYEPRDLTISVGAGMSYAALTRLLAGNRQMIPLDPPYASKATIGGVVATNLSGSRRRLFGTARDLVIGLEFATMDGKLVQSGGMVVKNVAGLDMGKLLIGSYGTLGVLCSINFKLIPSPPEKLTFVQSFATAAEAVAERNRLLTGVLQPSGIDLLNPAASQLLGHQGFLLVLPVGGSTVVLERYKRELSRYHVAPNDMLLGRIAEFPATFLSQHPKGAIARLSTRLQGLQPLLETEQRPLVVRAANGVAYLHLASAREPFPGVLEAGEERDAVVQWPTPGGDLAVMEKIKNMMDPQQLLNKGRLYGRI